MAENDLLLQHIMSAPIKKVALIGQPNVGKSATFNCLTGRYATVSNYPGTTVEVARGLVKVGNQNAQIIDTPGLYSTFPATEEERVTLDIIQDERPDIIIHIIDAKNLERMLPLTFQLLETGIPVIVALNMFDEALGLGITIDVAGLSEKLGLKIVATVAIERKGIGPLMNEIEEALNDTLPRPSGRWERPAFSEQQLRGWHEDARNIAAQVIKKRGLPRELSLLDRMVISPISGPLILAVVIYFGLYKFVGRLGAGTAVDLLEGNFERYISPWVTGVLSKYIPWHALHDLIAGKYGIITLGVRYAVAIILPIVGFFFLFFAVVEDSGYLPRLSFMLDRLFKKIGLSGKAVIPMVLGLGCSTMATMVTRTLPTRRERLIATILLSLCIPCSAQMGVILGLLSPTPKVLVLWAAIVTAIFVLIGTLLSRIMPGAPSAFIIELPPMRMPRPKNVLIKTYARMKWYFFEIIPLFILASVLIWLGELTGLFDIVTSLLKYPLALMGLPPEAAPAFLFGFFRRDYGAAGLYDLHKAHAFGNDQLLIAAVVLTLFLPCITQFLITIKERGWRTGIMISVCVLGVAFVTGVGINWTLITLGIHL